MKNLICLLIVSLMMLFGCSKDVLNDENMDLKRAKVPLPVKGEICMTYNYDVPLRHVEGTPVVINGKVVVPDLYLSGDSWLSGHVSGMGEILPNSPMHSLSAYLDMEALAKGRVVCVGEFEATAISDNGSITMLSTVRIDVTDNPVWSITGTYTVTGGTGKFEGVTGSGTLYGPQLPCWHTDGTIEFPAK